MGKGAERRGNARATFSSLALAHEAGAYYPKQTRVLRVRPSSLALRLTKAAYEI